MTVQEPPSLAEIRAYREVVRDRIVRTPVHEWRGTEVAKRAPDMRISIKFELLQMTGTFKARGALAWMLSLPKEKIQTGVTAVSAGNHAVAVSWAAHVMGAPAHVVIISPANPARIQQARAWGAKVELIDNAEAAFQRVLNIEREDGKTLVHPFEGRSIAIGTGALAMEWLEQAPDLDALVIPVGGGGLVAGVSAAVKRIRPETAVYGAEPFGADSMFQSLTRNEPVQAKRVDSIADSLRAPNAREYSFDLARRHMDDLGRVDDDEIRRAMRLILQELKLMVEPACATATAAALGPLRERLEGKHVGVLLCGSNIDLATFSRLIN
ncbi:MAG: pyridoxal-phosphate dependent enzyme [Gammaproteobacteria bacterium]|nr:pyridoxal-phosphate dependent enzyme [Gammaproteobacteria bacterium]MXZ29223.1 pyridoxal-phosphate dependent enzyme [Gammaproteobacteria bacterium]MYF58748.1 pyridoxal-phosphate dependent enzyme [Gammaproteobacteria bacterium]